MIYCTTPTWPAPCSRLRAGATHNALKQRGGRVTDEVQLLDPGNAVHQADRTLRLQRAAARAVYPQRADRHYQAER